MTARMTNPSQDQKLRKRRRKRENLPNLNYRTPKTHHFACDNPTNCTRWEFVANCIISLSFIAQHVIDKKLLFSLTRLSFPLVRIRIYPNKCIQCDWGETLRLRMCLCLSHSCERHCACVCVVRVNEPLMIASYLLSPVYSGRLEYICWNSFYPSRCIGALFRVRIPFRSQIQIPEVNPDSSPPVQSPGHLHTGHRIDTRDLPIFIPWLRSQKTTETPGLSITFGTLSAFRSFETKDYWTFSPCFYRISFCSRVYMYVLGMRLTVTAKANSLTAKANQLRMRYFYSGGQSVLEVLLLFTLGHRYHSPCFSLRELLLIS